MFHISSIAEFSLNYDILIFRSGFNEDFNYDVSVDVLKSIHEFAVLELYNFDLDFEQHKYDEQEEYDAWYFEYEKDYCHFYYGIESLDELVEYLESACLDLEILISTRSKKRPA